MRCVATSCGWRRVPPTTSRSATAVPLTEDEFLAVLSREVKTRRESVEAFRAGGREDLATKEEAEIAILAEYLPAALTEAEIAALVDEGIAATGASSARDMGKVMGWLAPRTRGRADGKHVSELVVQALAQRRSGRPRRRDPLSPRRRDDRTMLTRRRRRRSTRFTRSDAAAPRDRGRDPHPRARPRSSAPTSCPTQPLDAAGGQLATRDIVAPGRSTSSSDVQTDRGAGRRQRGRRAQYDFTTENAIAIAADQQLAFERRVDRIDTTFAATAISEAGKALLKNAVLGPVGRGERTTLVGLDAARWAVVRTEAARVLDATLAHRTARYGGRRDPDAPVRPDGGRARRGRADARRRAHRAAGRPELVVQPDAHDDRAGRPRRPTSSPSGSRSARARSSSATARRSRPRTSRRSTRWGSARRCRTSRASAAGP